MATDWAAEQLDAYNDIKEDGVEITIRANSYTTYDPKTDATTGATLTDYPTYAIVLSFKDQDDAMVHTYRNSKTNVKRGDRILLVPAYGLPDMSNPAEKQEFKLIMNSIDYRVVYAESIEPGGTAVLFRVLARR